MIEIKPTIDEKEPIVILKHVREGEIVPTQEASNALDLRYQGLDPAITNALHTIATHGDVAMVDELLCIFHMADNYHQYHPRYEETRREQFNELARRVTQIGWDIAALETTLAIILIYINKENLLAYNDVHDMKEWLTSQCSVNPDTANHSIEFANRWPQLCNYGIPLFSAMTDLSLPKVNQLKSLERKETEVYKQVQVKILEEYGYIPPMNEEGNIEEGIFTDTELIHGDLLEPKAIIEQLPETVREEIHRETEGRAAEQLRQKAIEILTPSTKDTIDMLQEKYRGGEQQPPIFYITVENYTNEGGTVRMKFTGEVQLGLSQVAQSLKNKSVLRFKIPEPGDHPIPTGYKSLKEFGHHFEVEVTEDLYDLGFTKDEEEEEQEEEEPQGYVPPAPSSSYR